MTLAIDPTARPIFRHPSTPIHANRIARIALLTLAEFAASIALTSICIPFIATWTASIEILTICLPLAGINFIIRIAANNSRDCKQKLLAEACCCSNFYHYSAIHAMTLIHETGHFCAVKLLTQSIPRIGITPFTEGWTKWSLRKLTWAGIQLGYRRSVFVILSAGTTFALTAAAITLITGLALYQSHSQTGFKLLNIGIYPFFHHAHYALSALWTPRSELRHDFVWLQTFGIHPLAASIAILSIPILISLGFCIPQLTKPQKTIN